MTKSKISLTAAQLRALALILMFIDHAGRTLFPGQRCEALDGAQAVAEATHENQKQKLRRFVLPENIEQKHL